MPGDALLYGAIGAALMAAVLLIPVSVPVQEHPVTAHIVDDGEGNMTLGVVLDAGKIAFGSVPRDAVRAERSLTVAHDGRGTLTLAVRGNITPLLTVDPERVPGGSPVDATLTLRPGDAAPGRYAGTLVVSRRVPLYEAIR